jgi:hypothetical protein
MLEHQVLLAERRDQPEPAAEGEQEDVDAVLVGGEQPARDEQHHEAQDRAGDPGDEGRGELLRAPRPAQSRDECQHRVRRLSIGRVGGSRCRPSSRPA